MKKEEPFSLSIPLIPKFEGGKLPDGSEAFFIRDWRRGLPFKPIECMNLKDLEVTSFRGTSRIIDAQENWEKTNQECRKRYEQGDETAVVRLLERDQRFAGVGWVKNALMKKIIKRGNRWGNNKVNRLIILGLVDSLTDKGMSQERAFHSLSKRIGIRYDRIKALYYESKKTSKYRPLFMPAQRLEDVGEPKGFESFLNGIREAFREGAIYPIEEILRTYSLQRHDTSSLQRHDTRKATEVISAYIKEAKALLKRGEFLCRGRKYKILESLKKQLEEQAEKAKVIRSSIGKK